MRVNLDFTLFIEVIEFEPFMGQYLEKYSSEFYEWFHYKRFPSDKTDSGFIYKDEIYNWDAVAIVDWMNEVAPECNAKIIERNIKPGDENTSLPYMKLG